MNKVKYGMPYLLDLLDIEQNVQLCEKIGLSFIELNTNLPHCQPDQINVRYLNRLKKQYGIEFTIDLLDTIDLGQFNRREREVSLKIIEETIGIADRLGVKILNLKMNPGINFTVLNDEVELYEAFKNDYLANIRACKEAIDLFLGGTKVMISLEIKEGLNRPHIQEAVEILLQSRRFGLTMDLNDVDYQLFTEDSFILKHADRIKYIHIQDKLLTNQDSFNLNKNNIREFFKLIEDNKPAILMECHKQEVLLYSVAKLKENIISIM